MAKKGQSKRKSFALPFSYSPSVSLYIFPMYDHDGK